MWKSHKFSQSHSCLYWNVPGWIFVWLSWTLILPFLTASTYNISRQLDGSTGSSQYLKKFRLSLKMHDVESNSSWHVEKPTLFLSCCEWCIAPLARGWTGDEILINWYLEFFEAKGGTKGHRFSKRLYVLQCHGGWELLLMLPPTYHLSWKIERTETPLPADTNLDQKNYVRPQLLHNKKNALEGAFWS